MNRTLIHDDITLLQPYKSHIKAQNCNFPVIKEIYLLRLSLYARLNRNVFTSDLKGSIFLIKRALGGRLFHRKGADAENALSPKDLVLDFLG